MRSYGERGSWSCGRARSPPPGRALVDAWMRDAVREQVIDAVAAGGLLLGGEVPGGARHLLPRDWCCSAAAALLEG